MCPRKGRSIAPYLRFEPLPPVSFPPSCIQFCPQPSQDVGVTQAGDPPFDIATQNCHPHSTGSRGIN